MRSKRTAYLSLTRLIQALILLVSLSCVRLAALARDSPQQSPVSPNKVVSVPINPGDSFEKSMAGGGRHVYRLEIPAGKHFRAVVQQLGINVVLAISQPNGTKLTEVDRPNGSRGRETISLIAPTTGTYILEVRSLESITAQGQYQLRVLKLRDEEIQDARWIEAERSVSKAETLRTQANVEVLKQAIAEFNRAAALWRSLSQPYEQAVALYASGLVHTALGENQKAILDLSQALSLFKEDSHGQAITKAALGWPYMYLGNNEKAEQNFAQSFQLYHTDGNVRGEGVALYGLGWVKALRDQNQEALDSFAQSLARRKTAKDRRGEALTLTGIGKLEARQRNYAKAHESLERALALIAGRDSYVEADILSNLGWLYYTLRDEAKALDYLTRALTLRRIVGDRTGEATTLYGIGKTHRRIGRP